MTTTPLYAVRRRIPHPQLSGQTSDLYMVYRPSIKDQPITWTRSIAKASRWHIQSTAQAYLSHALDSFDLQDPLDVLAL